MNNADYVSIFDFLLIWFQPIIWMYFFYFKTTKLDRLAGFGMPTVILFVMFGYLLRFIIPSLDFLFADNPIFNLFVFYIILGLSFASYLMLIRNWHFPQAISISGLIVFIGSFYWESPYLITNAFLIGFELDWFLHIMGLFVVWFIASSIGWKTDRRSLLIVALGFVIATLFMLGWYVPSSLTLTAREWASIWNSPYYMADRAICTIIAFSAIKMKAPVWRKKKVDNIQNTT